MEKTTYRHEMPLIALAAMPFVYCAIIWERLPETIPTHFNLHGQADGWMGKGAILLMPATGVFIYLLLRFIRYIDPKRMGTEQVEGAYYKIRVVVGVFIALISLFVMKSSLTGSLWPDTRIFAILPVAMLILLGNFMINIKPNWFIGIRTPWTLSSETVWKQTHRVGGRLFFYGGLACLILLLVLPAEWAPVLLLVYTLGAAAFSLVYSYILYTREKKQVH